MCDPQHAIDSAEDLLDCGDRGPQRISAIRNTFSVQHLPLPVKEHGNHAPVQTRFANTRSLTHAHHRMTSPSASPPL
eukprot:6192626-Pleurochrysis_carterae.AAC.4